MKTPSLSNIYKRWDVCVCVCISALLEMHIHYPSVIPYLIGDLISLCLVFLFPMSMQKDKN